MSLRFNAVMPVLLFNTQQSCCPSLQGWERCILPKFFFFRFGVSYFLIAKIFLMRLRFSLCQQLIKGLVRFSVVSNLPLAHIIDPKIEKTVQQRLLSNTTFTEILGNVLFLIFIFGETQVDTKMFSQLLQRKQFSFFEKSKTLFFLLVTECTDT